MDPSAFKCSQAGSTVRTRTGYWAFIPAAPPPSIEYSRELSLLLSQADAALSELSGLGRYLPNPSLFIEPYVRREAVASSRIEGTQADLDDLLLDELAPEQTSAHDDVREVRNYVAALNYGIGSLEKLPIASRLVREIHGVLMRGVRGDHATPGEFRTSQNWIGPPGSTIATATYVPPPPDVMLDRIASWEKFVNTHEQMPELIQCAIMHEHFEAIHPFLDGNGRVGRLLITLFLIERKRLSKPLLYLSSYIERTRHDYYELLQAIRTDCAWPEWIRYFLVAVRETSREAVRKSQHLLALREHYRGMVHQKHRSLALIDHVFATPYVDVKRATEWLGVTSPTATNSIRTLERIGLLQEVTGQRWGRVWAARPVLDAVQRSEEQPEEPELFPEAD